MIGRPLARTHGKTATYNRGCRCGPCSEVASRYRQVYQQRPATKALFAAYSRRRHSAYAARLAAIKLASGCLDCGYRAHPAALHFDHRPGSQKRFNLALGWGRTIQAVEDEMAKCDIVCANCHHVRTAERRAKKTTTG